MPPTVPRYVAATLVSIAIAIASSSVRASGRSIVVTASWTTGEGKVSLESHVRTEEVGVELAALFGQGTTGFRGKVGACTKRIVFRYPGTNEPDGRYFFANGRAIRLEPSNDHSGRSVSFSEAKNPAVSRLLAEIGPSSKCGR